MSLLLKENKYSSLNKIIGLYGCLLNSHCVWVNQSLGVEPAHKSSMSFRFKKSSVTPLKNTHKIIGSPAIDLILNKRCWSDIWVVFQMIERSWHFPDRACVDSSSKHKPLHFVSCYFNTT